MRRALSLLTLTGIFVALGTGDVLAKTCRDAHGHYTKCKAATHKMACRDARGRFVKCKH